MHFLSQEINANPLKMCKFANMAHCNYCMFHNKCKLIPVCIIGKIINYDLVALFRIQGKYMVFKTINLFLTASS